MSCVYCLVSTVLCLLSFFWYLLLYFSCRNQQTCLFMSVHWEGADRLEGWQDDQGPTKRAMVKIVSLRHHTCSSHRFWWNNFICNNNYNNHQIVSWQVVTKDSCRCGHPLISDPPTTSFTPLSLVTCDMRHVIFLKFMTCDTWQMALDMWHGTCDKWHMTHDMQHMTHNRLGRWTFCQNFSSLALTGPIKQLEVILVHSCATESLSVCR